MDNKIKLGAFLILTALALVFVPKINELVNPKPRPPREYQVIFMTPGNFARTKLWITPGATYDQVVDLVAEKNSIATSSLILLNVIPNTVY